MPHVASDHVRSHSPLTFVLAAVVVALAWAAMAPIAARERNHVLEIADGALARRLAGDITHALPLTVRLTVGVRDVLHVKNHDAAPHYLGAVLIKPGKELRLPFEDASQREFTSSAHVGGKLTVVVEPWPDPGTARLRWRTLEWVQAIRRY